MYDNSNYKHSNIEPFVQEHLNKTLKDRNLNIIIEKIATDKIKAMLK